MQHESLTLNDEKACLEELKKLRAARRAVAAHSATAGTAATDDGARAALVDRLKAADERLNAIKVEEEAARAELNAARTADGQKPGEKGNADVAALIASRNAARAASEEAYNKIKALRAEHKAAMDAWWASEKEFRAWRAEDKKAKNAAWEAERAAKDAERAARHAELAGEPFNREVATCEQLAVYLAGVAGEKADKAAPAPAAAADTTATAPPAGFAPVVKKDAVTDLAAFAACTTRGKGARARAAKATVKPAGGPTKKAMTHTLEIIAAFASVGVAVPLTPADVATASAALEGAKAGFLARREKVKANGGVDPDAPKEKKEEKKDSASKKGDKDAAPAVASPASDGAGVSVSIAVDGGGVDVKLTERVSSEGAAEAV